MYKIKKLKVFPLAYTIGLIYLIIGLVLIHLIVLHELKNKGNNPLGLFLYKIDKVSFDPYSYIKDFLGVIFFIIFFFCFIFFIPEKLNHSDNYIEANSLVTPIHIVPE